MRVAGKEVGSWNSGLIASNVFEVGGRAGGWRRGLGCGICDMESGLVWGLYLGPGGRGFSLYPLFLYSLECPLLL